MAARECQRGWQKKGAQLYETAGKALIPTWFSVGLSKERVIANQCRSTDVAIPPVLPRTIIEFVGGDALIVPK